MADEIDTIPQLIVIGSSAGGIDALSTIVSTLPADMPAPILVAQHLSPNRPSHLPEILQRQTSLAVAGVDGPAELHQGTIYVLPPGSGAEFSDHEIRLVEREERGPTPSIDHLFASAAQVFAEGLVAVILTGTGSDGAVGAREVKLAGGTVVVQNPATASYPGMPNALAPTSVDIVAELEAIGPLLYDLVTGANSPGKPDEERLLTTFLDELRERSGIDFSSYKRATILRRLQRRMAATGTSTLRSYVRYVHANPDEYQRLASSFLIKVTQFFRDPDLFEHLRKTIVPQLIATARERDLELRIWSAGCATGEEAYSLAMLITEELGADADQLHVRIFATDVDADAIGFARRGVYPAASVAELPPELVERHFLKVGDGYEIGKRIRAITVFGQHDLGQRAPFPRVDLALCRNVLIYFTADLQKRALQLFAFSLRDGGFLVLGKAESTTPLPDYFVLSEPRLKIYRRQGDRVLIPSTRIRDSAPVQIRPPSLVRSPWAESTLMRQRTGSRSAGNIERGDSLLLRLPVGVVVVNSRYDIQSINTAARQMLGVHGTAIGEDLVHLLPESVAADCRRTIDAALRGERAATTAEIDIVGVSGAESHAILITASPLAPEDTVEPVNAVVVVTADVTAAASARRDLETEIESNASDRARLADRAREIAVSHAELLDANSELTVANAELRTANEELMLANEEVQAATEEVETLNEELQATNEELETLNEELQATVEELNTTNDDLQARGVELQETTLRLDRQNHQSAEVRMRLGRLLDELDRGIALFGPDGEPAVTNARYREALGDGEVLDAAGKPIPPDRSPVERAGRGERFVERIEVRNGRKPAGTFEVSAEPLGVEDPGYTLLVVRRVDEPSSGPSASSPRPSSKRAPSTSSSDSA
jgi:two-component system, chemotaxis family, CheB/CheR fusion protein